MDTGAVRRQVAEELQVQFDSKLREAKRQKANAEEELESASERWRSERRKLNDEIDRLEKALAEERERREVPGSGASALDPQAIAKLQRAAEDKLKSVEAEWETECTRLTTQVARLERAVADAIERSNNPLRSTQPMKEQFEARISQVEKERLLLEQEFLRAKAMWDEDKKQMTGEIFKLRRLAPRSKALEVKEKLEVMQGRKETLEETRIRELEGRLTESHAEIQKFHQASLTAREETRNEYEPRLEQAYRERVKVEEQLATAKKQWDVERHQLCSQVAQLQQTLLEAKSVADSQPAEWRSSRESELLQEAGFQLEEATRRAGLAEERWLKERERLQGEVQQLQRTLSETREQVSAEIVDQLRIQYEQKLQEIIQQKTQLAQELHSASLLLQSERTRFAAEISKGGSEGVAGSSIDAEIDRVESQIQQIAALIDDPATELSMVIRKNVEKAELDAYLKGIMFSLGSGRAM